MSQPDENVAGQALITRHNPLRAPSDDSDAEAAPPRHSIPAGITDEDEKRMREEAERALAADREVFAREMEITRAIIAQAKADMQRNLQTAMWPLASSGTKKEKTQ